MEWLKNFQEGWLAHFNATREMDWSMYFRPRNRFAPSGPAIKLADSKLMLISSAGSYLSNEHDPFDSSNPLGDYSMRTYPIVTSFDEISFAHDHYDDQYIESDPQVLLPLQHLRDLDVEGIIGELAPRVISFSGYHPNVLRVVKELIPNILDVANEDNVNAVLLVPS